jgi:hypothetical protein
VKSWEWDMVLFVFASPILAVRAAVRFIRQVALLHRAAQPAINCGTCGSRISLVGFWRCSCGYTYQGHVLRYCPICGSFPRMVRCYECGATEKVLM